MPSVTSALQKHKSEANSIDIEAFKKVLQSHKNEVVYKLIQTSRMLELHLKSLFENSFFELKIW